MAVVKALTWVPSGCPPESRGNVKIECQRSRLVMLSRKVVQLSGDLEGSLKVTRPSVCCFRGGRRGTIWPSVGWFSKVVLKPCHFQKRDIPWGKIHRPLALIGTKIPVDFGLTHQLKLLQNKCVFGGAVCAQRLWLWMIEELASETQCNSATNRYKTLLKLFESMLI